MLNTNCHEQFAEHHRAICDERHDITPRSTTTQARDLRVYIDNTKWHSREQVCDRVA
jgi:hypothetical protein